MPRMKLFMSLSFITLVMKKKLHIVLPPTNSPKRVKLNSNGMILSMIIMHSLRALKDGLKNSMMARRMETIATGMSIIIQFLFQI